MFNNLFKSKKSAADVAKQALMLYAGYRVIKSTGLLNTEIGKAVAQPVREEAAKAIALNLYKAVF